MNEKSTNPLPKTGNYGLKAPPHLSPPGRTNYNTNLPLMEGENKKGDFTLMEEEIKLMKSSPFSRKMDRIITKHI